MDLVFDTTEKVSPTDEYWRFCIGSCHAATALREDYRKMLRTCRNELGFKYLRFHGLFCDDMCVIRRSLTGEYVLSFVNIDSIFDFLLSIGMKPFVEIGFMPECLKSKDETIFHYKANVTPPADEELWAQLVENFVRHMIDRYGRDEVRSWFFEIWNEPNLGKESGFKGGRFWSEGKEEYFRLYTITVKAIKGVDPALRVGGPATSNNAWIPDMLDYCEKSGTPIDFVTTHHYPTDIVLGYGVEDSANFVTAFNTADSKSKRLDIIKDYLTFQHDIWKKVDRGVLTQMTKRAVSECRGLPLYYTEWSSLAGIQSDGEFGASFILKTIQDNSNLVKGYSYWTFCDIVEEKGMPDSEFHGGFGLMTVNGVRKAPYNAFKLLASLPEMRYEKTFSCGTVDIYFFTDSERSLYRILAVNHNSLLHDISEEKIKISVSGAKLLAEADIVRLDQCHGNALARWREMGSPAYPSKKQLLELHAASCLVREKTELVDGALEFALPPQGAALITLYPQERRSAK